MDYAKRECSERRYIRSVALSLAARCSYRMSPCARCRRDEKEKGGVAWWRVVWIELRASARLAHRASCEGTRRPCPNLTPAGMHRVLKTVTRFPSAETFRIGRAPQISRAPSRAQSGCSPDLLQMLVMSLEHEPPCVDIHAQASTTPLNNRSRSDSPPRHFHPYTTPPTCRSILHTPRLRFPPLSAHTTLPTQVAHVAPSHLCPPSTTRLISPAYHVHRKHIDS